MTDHPTIHLDGGEGTVSDGTRTVAVECCPEHEWCCVLTLGDDVRHVWDESLEAREVVRVACEMLGD